MIIPHKNQNQEVTDTYTQAGNKVVSFSRQSSNKINGVSSFLIKITPTAPLNAFTLHICTHL